VLAIIPSATLLGVEGRPVAVEVHVAPGLPSYTVVGLPDTACRESRDRVRAALVSSGIPWPLRRVTVNLAPSDLRKSGAGLDLAIAVGLLVAAGLLDPVAVEGCGFVGELGLDGALRGGARATPPPPRPPPHPAPPHLFARRPCHASPAAPRPPPARSPAPPPPELVSPCLLCPVGAYVPCTPAALPPVLPRNTPRPGLAQSARGRRPPPRPAPGAPPPRHAPHRTGSHDIASRASVRVARPCPLPYRARNPAQYAGALPSPPCARVTAVPPHLPALPRTDPAPPPPARLGFLLQMLRRPAHLPRFSPEPAWPAALPRPGSRSPRSLTAVLAPAHCRLRPAPVGGNFGDLPKPATHPRPRHRQRASPPPDTT
jgi:hypothetical protein